VAEGPSSLSALGLGCRLSDGSWAFRDVDLELRAGQLRLLAGRNGAGKTLLARHLAGLLGPTEGRVLFEGVELPKLGGSLASRIGYVFQDARLQTVGETVLDDALFGPTCLRTPPSEAAARASEALLACGLAGKEERFVHELSGGELRRLGIAGALATGPKVLILDEPFANLDPDGVRDTLGILKDLRDSGMALLVITHEIEKVLGLASEFFVMDQGKIVLSGSPEDVLRRGIEGYGLRDPFRPRTSVKDLSWL